MSSPSFRLLSARFWPPFLAACRADELEMSLWLLHMCILYFAAQSRKAYRVCSIMPHMCVLYPAFSGILLMFFLIFPIMFLTSLASCDIMEAESNRSTDRTESGGIRVRGNDDEDAQTDRQCNNRTYYAVWQGTGLDCRISRQHGHH